MAAHALYGWRWRSAWDLLRSSALKEVLGLHYLCLHLYSDIRYVTGRSLARLYSLIYFFCFKQLFSFVFSHLQNCPMVFLVLNFKILLTNGKYFLLMCLKLTLQGPAWQHMHPKRTPELRGVPLCKIRSLVLCATLIQYFLSIEDTTVLLWTDHTTRFCKRIWTMMGNLHSIL